MDNSLIGKSIDRYNIIEQLGEGGMAIVYKAYDTQLQREVAIKVIRRDSFPPNQHERILKRFENEARALAQLAHPNIVKVHDFGEHNGVPYLVMEYLPGGTVKQLQKDRGLLDWQETVKLLLPVAESLQYAHSMDIIHRDVKPSNILFNHSGDPMLTDFGISKILISEEDMTSNTLTGSHVGTFGYMSLEQADGRAVDGRTDVYALGVVIYELLAGRRPYKDISDTPLTEYTKQSRDPLPRPSQFLPGLPVKVEKVLAKALAKQPEDRYLNMGEFIAALEGLLREERPKPNWTLKGIGVAVFIGLVLLGWFLYSAIDIGKRIFPGQITQVVHPESINATSLSATVTPLSIPSSSTPRPSSTPTDSVAPDIFTRTGDGMEMVFIPEGEFEMGSLEGSGRPDTQPQHEVYISGFWIDRTEVTNGMYEKCVQDDGCQLPANTSSYTREVYFGKKEYVNFPVVFVTWFDAQSYCTWAGARLPTEAEWEKAARGQDKRDYPWGNANPSMGLLNYLNQVGDTISVGSYPKGASPYGVVDMAGNVTEWVSDWYDESYYQNSSYSNPEGPSSSPYGSRVVRGGSYSGSENDIISTNRILMDPNTSYDSVGFRCASSVNPDDIPKGTAKPTPLPTPFDAGFQGGITIQGQVVFEDSLVNKEILVHLPKYDPSVYGYPLYGAVGPSITDVDGNYRFVNVNPSNRYIISAEGKKPGYSVYASSEALEPGISLERTITVPKLVIYLPREVSFEWIYQPRETSDFRQGNPVRRTSTLTTPAFPDFGALATECFDSSTNSECWKDFYISFDNNETCLYANNSEHGGIYDVGEVEIDTVIEAPENVFYDNQCTLAKVGHTYVLKLSDGIHYAKIRITDIQKGTP